MAGKPCFTKYLSQVAFHSRDFLPKKSSPFTPREPKSYLLQGAPLIQPSLMKKFRCCPFFPWFHSLLWNQQQRPHLPSMPGHWPALSVVTFGPVSKPFWQNSPSTRDPFSPINGNPQHGSPVVLFMSWRIIFSLVPSRFRSLVVAFRFSFLGIPWVLPSFLRLLNALSQFSGHRPIMERVPAERPLLHNLQHGCRVWPKPGLQAALAGFDPRCHPFDQKNNNNNNNKKTEIIRGAGLFWPPHTGTVLVFFY